MKALILSLCLLAQAQLCQPSCGEERQLPLIYEEMDAIVVVQTIGCDHSRIVFMRDKQVIATRLMVDDMLWNVTNDGEFQLIWQDYWTAERVIKTRKLAVLVMEEDPTQEGQDGLWWCMFRNMKDLKQP